MVTTRNFSPYDDVDFVVYRKKSIFDSSFEENDGYGSDDDVEPGSEHGQQPCRDRQFEKRLGSFYKEIGYAFQDVVNSLSTASCEAPSTNDAQCFDARRFDLSDDNFSFGEESFDDASILSLDEKDQEGKMDLNDFLKYAKEDLKKIHPDHSGTTDTESTSSDSEYSKPSDAGCSAKRKETSLSNHPCSIRQPKEMNGGFLLRTRSAPMLDSENKKREIQKSRSYDSADWAKIAVAMNRKMMEDVSSSTASNKAISKFTKTQQYKSFEIDFNKTLSDILEEEEEEETIDIDALPVVPRGLSEIGKSKAKSTERHQSKKFGSFIPFRTTKTLPHDPTEKPQVQPKSLLLEKAKRVSKYFRSGRKNEVVHHKKDKNRPFALETSKSHFHTMSTLDGSFDTDIGFSNYESGETNSCASFEECIVFREETGFEVSSGECVLFDQDNGFEIAAPSSKVEYDSKPTNDHASDTYPTHSNENNDEHNVPGNGFLNDNSKSLEKATVPVLSKVGHIYSSQYPSTPSENLIKVNKKSRSIIAGVTFEVQLSASMENWSPKTRGSRHSNGQNPGENFILDRSGIKETEIETTSVDQQRDVDSSHFHTDKNETIPVTTRVYLEMNTPKKSTSLSRKEKHGWKNRLRKAASGMLKLNKKKDPRSFAFSENTMLSRSTTRDKQAKVEPLFDQVRSVESAKEGPNIDLVDTESSLSFAFSDSIKKLSMMQVISAINAELQFMNEGEKKKKDH